MFLRKGRKRGSKKNPNIRTYFSSLPSVYSLRVRHCRLIIHCSFNTTNIPIQEVNTQGISNESSPLASKVIRSKRILKWPHTGAYAKLVIYVNAKYWFSWFIRISSGGRRVWSVVTYVVFTYHTLILLAYIVGIVAYTLAIVAYTHTLFGNQYLQTEVTSWQPNFNFVYRKRFSKLFDEKVLNFESVLLGKN